MVPSLWNRRKATEDAVSLAPQILPPPAGQIRSEKHCIDTQLQPYIFVENLKKNFDGLVAVDNVSFCVYPSEVFGLLGSNGAGKTTTIHMLTGLLEPTGGHVFIKNMDITTNPLEIRRTIGYLPEFPALYERLTGCEYLRLIGRLRRMDEGELEIRIKELTELLGLAGRLEGLTGTYSRGMQQKLAFISAVLHDPELIFFDEPTANLDPRLAKIIKDWILNAKARGRTIVLSTHITEIAEVICDRLIILDEGRIKISGTPKDILKQTGTKNLEDAFIQIIGG